jgi:hypothetical protein
MEAASNGVLPGDGGIADARRLDRSKGWKRPIRDEDAARITADIQTQGYAIVSDCFAAGDLERLQDHARAAMDGAPGQYVRFAGADSPLGEFIANLAGDDVFRNLCRRFYEVETSSSPNPSNERFFHVFRGLIGAAGRQESLRFHYDSYVLTVVIPVLMPSRGKTGNLLILPQARPIRRSYFRNVLDKLVVDSPPGQIVLRRAARAGRQGAKSVRLRPGDIYFFSGYRSIHTNDACELDEPRATALLHYGDPHAGSRARVLIRKLRRLSDA